MKATTVLVRICGVAALAAGSWVPAASVRADGGAQDPPGESQQDELARRATDPTASPPTFSFINDITTSYRDLDDGTPIDDTGYQFRFQPVIPFFEDLPGASRFKFLVTIQLLLPEGKK